MNLNTASIKSLLHAKVLETEGVIAANFASEGTVFTPPDDAGMWFREVYNEWLLEHPADGIERFSGSVTYEVNFLPATGMSAADAVCDGMASLFDPMNGTFGDTAFRIQPVSVQRLGTSGDTSWITTGVRIAFLAYRSEV